MEQHIVKILSIENVTHDVKRFRTERPENYNFTSGQATEVAVNKPGFQNETRPFTFTGLNDWNYLEFTIKIYPDHNGVTRKLSELVPGDSLIIHDVWGTIDYKGPGTFIAGGAGITPFISIFRSLKSRNELWGNRLIFANKTKADIILEEEFKSLLGKCFINILSDEESNGYAHGFITCNFLKDNQSKESKFYYVCGPPPMMSAVEDILKELKIDEKLVIKEGI